MIPIQDYLIFSTILFSIGLVGMIINRHYLIQLLLCVEIMLLAVNTNFIAFSHYYSKISGQVFVFFILTVAAAEAAIGLAILMLYYRKVGNIDLETMNKLRG